MKKGFSILFRGAKLRDEQYSVHTCELFQRYAAEVCETPEDWASFEVVVIQAGHVNATLVPVEKKEKLIDIRSTFVLQARVKFPNGHLETMYLGEGQWPLVSRVLEFKFFPIPDHLVVEPVSQMVPSVGYVH
jgi:hypothetical protein